MSSILDKEFIKEREENVVHIRDITVLDGDNVTHKRVSGVACMNRFNEFRRTSHVTNRCRLNNRPCVMPNKNERTCTIPNKR